MNKKNVYASLEIADQEVRLVILEIFDGRFNVLRVERVACQGAKNQTIENESLVIKAIQEALDKAYEALGYRIERVFLAIPSNGVRRTNQKVRVQIEDGSTSVRLSHIQQGYAKAIQRKLSDDVEFVNTNRITYTVNGEEQTTMPIDVECEYFFMDVDLLYADKETIYAYARCVEQANLEILDLCLDAYAVAQESGVMVKSEDRSILQLDLDRDHCTLTHFSKNRLENCITIDLGYASFIQDIQDKYELTDAESMRMLQNVFTDTEADSGNTVVYNEDNKQITSKELTHDVLLRIREWIQIVNRESKPILDEGKASFVLTGKGANITIMKKMIEQLKADAILYLPQTTGARDGSFICGLGMAYAFYDMNQIRKIDKISVNQKELEESIVAIRQYSKDEDGAFTKKLKNVILTEE